MLSIKFLTGVGLGYVLGAAAGRQRYDQIKSAASSAWGNPKVRQSVSSAQESAVQGARTASDKLGDVAPNSPAAARAKEVVDKATTAAEEKLTSSGTSGSGSSGSGGGTDSGGGSGSGGGAKPGTSSPGQQAASGTQSSGQRSGSQSSGQKPSTGNTPGTTATTTPGTVNPRKPGS